MHGFASGPSSRKARFFAEHFAHLGVHVEIPDLAAGNFERLTVTGQLAVLEEAAQGEPVTLIGSSLGGYLAALFAAEHTFVERLVLLAPAFHFRRLWVERIGEEAWQRWQREGHVTAYHYALGRPASISFDLMRDAERYPAEPNFTQPALIFHGMRDDIVPVESSVEYARTHPNARLITVDSGHELTDVLDRIWNDSKDFLCASECQIEC